MMTPDYTPETAPEPAFLRTESSLQLFDALPDPVIVTDLQLTIVDLNPAAEALFGYPGAILIAMSVHALTEDLDGIEPDIDESLLRGGAWRGELRMQTRCHGTRDIEATLLSVPDRPLKLLICHDITDHKEREQALWRRTEQDIASERRKQEFVAMLSHELRNPLAPITTSLALMRRTGISDPLLASSHAIIERQVAHLRHLVNDLLDAARIDNGKMVLSLALLPVQALIDQALETSRPEIRAAGHRLDVQAALAPALWLHGDLTRLAQALSNVFDNAAKFTPDGGIITLGCHSADGHVCITVSDSGPGISAAFQPRLFELFSQADETLARSDGGLGVGLSVTRQILALHGGSITVCSNGTGSKFTLRLPLARDMPQTTTGEPNVAPTPNARQGFRILLVDDNEDANESMAALLDMMEYDVRTATSGAVALTVAQEFAPQLILSDIGLPGMDGYQLAPALRRLAGERKVILVAATGYGHANDRARSEAAGFDHHLVKPLDADMLLEFVGSQADAY